MAGLAMEMGLPGSQWLKDTLDWREDVVPDFKEELLFAAGGFMGIDECARKFSCRMLCQISRRSCSLQQGASWELMNVPGSFPAGWERGSVGFLASNPPVSSCQEPCLTPLTWQPTCQCTW